MTMLKTHRRGLTLLTLLSLVVLATAAWAEDWPKWRGPRGDGIVKDANLAESWPFDGPPELWNVTVGSGYASPVAVDDIVYVFTQNGGMSQLCAVDIATRSKLWTNSYPTAWKDRKYPGPRATPTIVDDLIYTLDGGGELCCWQRNGGAIVWRKNLLSESGSKNLTWGCASTVMVDGETLYVQVGYEGPIAAAINRRNGEVLWWSQYKGFSGYAPIVKGVAADGDEMLIVFGGVDIVAMDPKTGETYWNFPYETDWKVNAATPIVHGDKAVFTNEYKSGKAAMLNLSKYRTKVIWTNPGFCSRFATPILENGLLYGHDRGKLKCIRWDSGEEIWSDPDPKVNLGMGGTLVKAGDKTIALSDSGQLWLLAMGPEGAKVISTTRLLHEKNVWSTPLLYGGRLFVKSSDKLICLDVAPKTRPTAEE